MSPREIPSVLGDFTAGAKCGSPRKNLYALGDSNADKLQDVMVKIPNLHVDAVTNNSFFYMLLSSGLVQEMVSPSRRSIDA